ncbi:MAG: asparagine synthase-related protein [Nanobdellota archaeon]
MNHNLDSWTAFLSSIHQQTVVDTRRSHQKTIEELSSLLESTILRQADNMLTKGSIGLLFSGGVDSTFIAHVLTKHNKPFKAITIGFQDNDSQKYPDDVASAIDIAKELSLDFSFNILDFRQIRESFLQTAQALGSDAITNINIGVGSVEYSAIRELLRLDPAIKGVFGGLGSEEIFAGYQRHLESENSNDECWKGLFAMFERDIMREQAIAKHFGVELLVPFLDSHVISYAMTIPSQMKLNDEGNKYIFRESAVYNGLCKSWAFRPKKAAQYGSRTQHALAKVSRQEGFRYISLYLDSLKKNC